MSLRVVVPPRPIITWELAQMHLRGVAGDEERELVEGYIAAATAWLDGPDGWLGRCLGEQTLELSVCCLCDGALPCGPVVSIDSITYLDRAGVEQVMPETDYRLLTDGILHADRWPVLASDKPDAVRIRYVAGYPDREEEPEGGGEPVVTSTVPPPIRQAILLLLGQWFDHREAVSVGAAPSVMPFAVDALLSPYRVWS